MEKILFHISGRHKDELTIVAEAKGLSRAAYLRTIIIEKLKEEREYVKKLE